MIFSPIAFVFRKAIDRETLTLFYHIAIPLHLRTDRSNGNLLDQIISFDHSFNFNTQIFPQSKVMIAINNKLHIIIFHPCT